MEGGPPPYPRRYQEVENELKILSNFEFLANSLTRHPARPNSNSLSFVLGIANSTQTHSS